MCHMARTSMDTIEEFYGDRTILEGLWPVLTSPVFFMWDFLKKCIHENNLQGIQQYMLMSCL
jgi:hypothetical protein